MSSSTRQFSYQQQGEISPLFIDGSEIATAQGKRALSQPKSQNRLYAAVATLLLVVVSSVALVTFSNSNAATMESSSRSETKPHTGDHCSTTTMYTKENLKSLVDKPVAALLQSKDLKGQRKFEASDVLLKEGYYYAICDSSWSILKIREDLPTLSEKNYHLGDPIDFDPTSESGFEGIFEDFTTGNLFVVRESVDLSGFAAEGSGINRNIDDDDDDDKRYDRRRRQLGLAPVTDDPSYHALVMQVEVDDAEGTYDVVDACPSEIEFDGDSKGFEGAVSIRGADGVLYFLGLCEGNHCKEGKEGRDKGNGMVVVMARTDANDDDEGGGADDADDDEGEGEEELDDIGSGAGAGGGPVAGFDCYWKTVATLDLPSSADFQDYSAISLHRGTMHVAVTSQENAQVWVGKLEGGRDGLFDPAAAFFHEEGGKVYDFPRNQNCEVQYCNIEGVYWVEGGSSTSGDSSTGGGDDDEEGEGELGDPPQVLVAVSDKMKGKGKQPYTCLEKDQSFHLFAIP